MEGSTLRTRIHCDLGGAKWEKVSIRSRQGSSVHLSEEKVLVVRQDRCCLPASS